jgi:hypothetical protein
VEVLSPAALLSIAILLRRQEAAAARTRPSVSIGSVRVETPEAWFLLQVGGARLGVLDVFRRDAGPLTGDQLTDALLLTDLTVSAVRDRQENTGGSDDLDATIRHRAELFRAQGMVMVQLGVPLDEAMVRLRAHAYARNRRLDDLARDVVAGRIRFTPRGALTMDPTADEAGRPE